ncbi:hypothetical protein AURDEDRAFT_131390 [Auricularia subglabra TFB-10046 SS5]|uniref:F-box domain-containing protein n=1 Tax=Auricularia subglabra (strain TFB-10046 / SS5) TaxID=717982 RepID=J0CUK7_AURST|nr:hypothetical protein AURDEDRAFT_131390 [Auricularia subglabra TFB-10046 SS5]
MAMTPVAALNSLLPPELLNTVFTHLAFRDRVQTSHVCKAWRRASLAHPASLWSSICCNAEQTEMLSCLLERSNGAPVDVQVVLTDTSCLDALLAISLHLYHIRTLHLRFTASQDIKLSFDSVRAVHLALAGDPASLLEVLKLEISIDYGIMGGFLAPNYTAHENLLASHAPRLREVTLFSTSLDPAVNYPALRHVERYSIGTRHLSASHLSAIFTNMPALKFLSIRTDAFDLPNTPLPPTVRLETLYIKGSEDLRHAEGLLPLLKYLNYERIPRVTTSAWSLWLNRFTTPPRSLPHTLDISRNETGRDRWTLVHPEGYTSVCLELRSGSELRSRPVPRQIFQRLETLLVMLDLLEPCSEIALLPRLARLVLREPDGGEVIRYFAAMDYPPRLHCAVLRVVEIWGTDEVLRVSADDVCNFVDACLVCDADQPPRIVLRNAELRASASGKSRKGFAYDLTVSDEIAPTP